MPDSRMTNKNGMVSKIQTRIRTDLFKNNYDLVGKELGRGKFAVVKKCIEKTTGKEYAAKFLRKRRKGEDCRMDIIHEIAVLESAKSNPFVVSLHETLHKDNGLSPAMNSSQGAAGGEIFNQCVADNDEAFTEQDVIRLARQILMGVACLHRNNVVHLDLKPQNILLTSSRPLGDIRIVDFGLSRCMDNIKELREILGTPESIGVLTYVMLTGESPFLGSDKQETFLNISQINVDYSQDVFEGVSSLAIDFIKSLLQKNPRKRATAEECLKHPWLSGHPHSHLHSSHLSSLDEPETPEESDPEPESPASTPKLVIMASYTLCSSQREIKPGRGTFTFDEPFHTHPEIKQELIC
ncbi:hypothetical protein JZ751_026489 [Albula glossodonta]|uniref:non-specific serine/threonine protein kinase n=1 Tax=Albula glossodonta TaxID=121402 RepID=A0A8T2PEK2_9TELE|nr:hypothetical protein JZ751_026489 [Albula glossodonta]